MLTSILAPNFTFALVLHRTTVWNWMDRGKVDVWIIPELNNLKLINLKGKDPQKK